jgi:hypothetical protein
MTRHLGNKGLEADLGLLEIPRRTTAKAVRAQRYWFNLKGFTNTARKNQAVV